VSLGVDCYISTMHYILIYALHVDFISLSLSVLNYFDM